LNQQPTAITLQARHDADGVLRIHSMDGSPVNMVALPASTVEKLANLSTEAAQYYRRVLGQQPMATSSQMKKAAHRGNIN